MENARPRKQSRGIRFVKYRLSFASAFLRQERDFAPFHGDFARSAHFADDGAHGAAFHAQKIRHFLPSGHGEGIALPGGLREETSVLCADAMAVLARTGGMTGVDFTGKRYDMGNKLGVMEAQVETALKHPEIGPAFRAYLKELSKTL